MFFLYYIDVEIAKQSVTKLARIGLGTRQNVVGLLRRPPSAEPYSPEHITSSENSANKFLITYNQVQRFNN